ncbi:hypothetical protein SODALDRAFT_78452 [Sodiomyces alkalinus F11]|uniref:Uncharacterized protein n=1 Tax=Sodiomyces alkalinus (strain CBS 110278 / VKM F-3762 / F11) TaxID=1314773 RepID=A0A3N2PL59_SODAK|nr:hypothetical protein SODALDRAFT_78452 [Sodiomyces alkalinus F11]ROT35144.1 hypothetical protein SODALDRAFT_78452 [Sodiomyces alkalinus F11]
MSRNGRLTSTLRQSIRVHHHRPISIRGPLPRTRSRRRWILLDPAAPLRQLARRPGRRSPWYLQRGWKAPLCDKSDVSLQPTRHAKAKQQEERRRVHSLERVSVGDDSLAASIARNRASGVLAGGAASKPSAATLSTLGSSCEAGVMACVAVARPAMVSGRATQGRMARGWIISRRGRMAIGRKKP